MLVGDSSQITLGPSALLWHEWQGKIFFFAG
jgi:hypothetical protein